MIKAVITPALSAALVAAAAGAVFAAADEAGANTFTRGSVDLSVAPASAAVSFTGMAPGDRATAPLTVRNDGTVRLRYAVTSTATNADSKSLAGQLDLTVKTGVDTCSDGGFATDGIVLYGPADVGSMSGIDVIGGGDRILDAGDSEVLCISVALPSGTGNAFQGASTSATCTFDAEPVANT
jgi:hypothetical protein